MRRTVLLAALAIALSGCEATATVHGECIYLPTGERLTFDKGDKATVGFGSYSIPLRDKDGYMTLLTNANAHLFRCRRAPR